MLVCCSRASDGTGFRWEGDFQGAYADKSWKDLPVCLYEEAWNLGLIDVSWYCQQYCDGGVTGGGTDRTLRTAYDRDRKRKAQAW